MTVAEAAKALGIDYDYCLRLIRVGRLQARKQGKVWVVDDHSVTQRACSLSHVKEQQNGTGKTKPKQG